MHRAEILQLRGSWTDALDEAQPACTLLSAPPPQHAAGMAFYQLGELHRLRGTWEEAEEAYLQASRRGRHPSPAWPSCGWPRATRRWRPRCCARC